MRVPCEAKLSRDDRPLLYRGLAISNTCSHAKNRNDPVPITWSKVALPAIGFSAVAILGGGWLQSPASDGPPCPLFHRGRETSSCPGRHFSNPENTNVSWRLPNLYPESYDWGLPDHRLVDWPHGLTSLDRHSGLAGGHRSGHELLPRINKQKQLNMRRNRTWWNDKT